MPNDNAEESPIDENTHSPDSQDFVELRYPPTTRLTLFVALIGCGIFSAIFLFFRASEPLNYMLAAGIVASDIFLVVFLKNIIEKTFVRADNEGITKQVVSTQTNVKWSKIDSVKLCADENNQQQIVLRGKDKKVLMKFNDFGDKKNRDALLEFAKKRLL